MRDWLRDTFEGRPWWMNVMMGFCAFMTFVYVPWDLFWKPIASDEEVWFGYLFTGWAAKATEPLHWFVYGALFYGFLRMRPWIRVAASAYLFQIAFGMFVWTVIEYGSLTGIFLGLIAALPFSALTLLVWNAREHFDVTRSLGERYGEWALVTGASSGIGVEALARALARRGVACVLTARRGDNLERLAQDLERRFGVKTRTAVADLATREGVDQLLEAVRDLEISILVSNAGVGYGGRFDLQDTERLRSMIELNCVAPVALIKALLPGMRDRGRGAILVTGSVSGRQAIPLHAAYSATKVFEQFLGEALWVELRGTGVDVLVVEPGTTARTEFQDAAGQLPHPGEDPTRVAETALAALGRQSSVITTWFHWIRTELATRVAPRGLVHYVARDVMRPNTPEDLR